MVVLVLHKLLSRKDELRPGLDAFPLTTFLGCLYIALLIIPAGVRHSWLVIVPCILAFAFILWFQRGNDGFALSRLRRAWPELGVATLLAIFFALRPVIFEYPSDNVDYLSWLLGALVDGPQRLSAQSCSIHELLTYSHDCKIWLSLARFGPALPIQWIFPFGFSLPRLIVCTEVFLFCLALQRLLRLGGIAGWRSALTVVLVLSGLGNKGISFVINHALQGSLLAAALLTEVFVLLLCVISALQHVRFGALHRYWPSLRILSTGAVLFALQFFLLLRLHGLFALLALVAVIPMMLFVGADGMSRFGLLGLRRSDAWVLLILGSVFIAMLIGPMGAWRVEAADTWYVQRWTWMEAFGIPYEALPASFMTRAPHSRPEFLAVAGILLAFVTLLGLYTHSKWLSPIGDGDYIVRYAVVSSFYAVSIACAILLPPFSNVFLNLNIDLFSHYRLMWGAVLFSPFPLWLSLSSRLFGFVAGLLTALTLLPIPFWSLTRPQLLHSKSRHIFVAPHQSADQELLLRELMPVLARPASSTSGLRSVLADPQVNGSLMPLAPGRIKLLVPSYRLTRPDRMPRLAGRQSEIPSQILESLRAMPQALRPDWIIQRLPSGCSYSAYVDSDEFDPCITSKIGNAYVNGLTPQQISELGYSLVGDAAEPLRFWLRAGLLRNNESTRKAP